MSDENKLPMTKEEIDERIKYLISRSTNLDSEGRYALLYQDDERLKKATKEWNLVQAELDQLLKVQLVLKEGYSLEEIQKELRTRDPAAKLAEDGIGGWRIETLQYAEKVLLHTAANKGKHHKGD